MNKKIGIKEFAEKLGVSTATVSRAFGASGRISDKTRKRILLAAEEFGYYANFNASNLSVKRSKSVYFFYPELYSDEPDYFISEIVIGVNNRLSNDKVLQVTPYDENDEVTINSCKQQILDGRVASAIIFSDSNASTILAKLCEKRAIPYVIIGNNKKFSHNVVEYDNYYGAKLAGNYLKSIGRKKIAYVMCRHNDDKINGFADGFGIDKKNLLIISCGVGFQYGARAMEDIVNNYPDIDGILCANDILAIGLINQACKLGINIPEKLSVIGFDDIAFSKYFNPSLSTVSLNLKDLGAEAVGLLEQQLANGGVATKVLNVKVRCDLIIREST